jgi:hypothetical protein
MSSARSAKSLGAEFVSVLLKQNACHCDAVAVKN